MHVIQQSTNRGVRFSASRAYVNDNPLPNLTVITGTTVARVVIEGSRAIGVEMIEDGARRTSAPPEVIVSAGAYGSPHILMLSGVGHADHLGQFGITVPADLPVGDNLHDHLFVPLSFQIDYSPNTANADLLHARASLKERRRKAAAPGPGHSSSRPRAFVRTSHAATAPGPAAAGDPLDLPRAQPRRPGQAHRPTSGRPGRCSRR